MKYTPVEQAVIDFVIKQAKSAIHPSQIILFGSRGRRDARDNSDYDFAFIAENEQFAQSDWAQFVVDTQEHAPTLLSLDLVNMHEISKDFYDKILSEGVTIYQQKRTQTK